MTFYTNILLALLAIYCGLRISELYWQKFHLFHFHLSWTFYTLAAGALLGAIAHGFSPNFPPILKMLVWKATVLSAGLTAMFFVLTSLAAVMSFESYTLLRWIPILGLIIYAVIIWRDSQFIQAMKFTVPAMIFVLAAMIYIFGTTKDAGAGNIILGLLITSVGAVLWAVRFSPHSHFNHNDIYHLVQMVGLWFIYRGGLAIKNILN